MRAACRHRIRVPIRQMTQRVAHFVELPLAVPAIIAGLRIAVVSTVAIATIAATLLPKGLGFPMLLALAEPTPFKTEIYSTGILAVALALSCDFALVGLRRMLVPWASRRVS